MKKIISTITSSKRLLYLSTLFIIVLFCAVLNITFSAFTAGVEENAAYLRVGTLSYNARIDGVETYIYEATAQDITKNNLVIMSTNTINTKYELTYEVCSDSACNTVINTPAGLTVEYSSKTTDPVTGSINSGSSVFIRLVTTNTTSTTYYIRIGINAGLSANPLLLTNQINSEYAEDDLQVTTYVNGSKVDNFPTTPAYWTTVECTDKLGSPINTTGYIGWNGTQWVLSVNNLYQSETKCNAYFDNSPTLYKIEELVRLSNEVRSGMTYSGVTFNLNNDLDFQSTSSYADSTRTDFGDVNNNGTVESLITELTSTSANGFPGIGTINNKFSGNFNGGSHTISNLYIKGPSSGTNYGFFGVINNSTISYLNLSGSISTDTTATIGGMVGLSQGTSTISNCTSAVSVTSTASDYPIGGLVGHNVAGSLTITGSTNSGAVTGGGSTGGLVGENEYSGSAGSLTITGSHNTGTITNSSGSFAGGLLASDINSGSTISISNSDNTGAINISSTLTFIAAGIAGRITGTANFNTVTNNAKITFTNNTTSDTLAKRIGGMAGSVTSTANLTCTSCTNSKAIAVTTYSGSVYLGGLIGDSAATITITGSTNSGGVSYTNNAGTNYNGNIGGIIGSTSGSSATVKISTTTNTGSVTNGRRTGGFIGANAASYLLINRSYNTAAVKENCSTYTSGWVAGGGLIGWNNAYEKDWTVKAIILNSYNSGAVTVASGHNTSHAGGLVAYNTYDAILLIINSYNIGNVKANTTAGNYAAGIVNNTSGTVTLKNTYSYSTITGGDSSKGFQIGRLNANTYTIDGTNYYLSTKTASNQSSVGTGKTAALFQGAASSTTSVTYLLNHNSYTLKNLDSSLNGLSKASWVLNSSNNKPALSL